MKTNVRPSIDDIWRWLADVPDPEIPVLSVTDLGIVRDIAWELDELVITVTPTYSGCPATAVISFEIEETMSRRGVEKMKIKSQIAPPWTTRWISDEGRKKLKSFGIAPPIEGDMCAGAIAAQKVLVKCPRCGSVDTECVSKFGSTPCKAAYRCKACLEPFDYFKSF